jgi:hypothetical protein
MFRHRLFLASAFLVTVAGPRPSRADDNGATARAMFEQATRDMDAGDYDKACPALVTVVRLSRGIGSMIKLGKCYEAQGRLASAWASFKAAAEAAHLAQDAREAGAEAKAEELFPKLSRLSVAVGPESLGVGGLTIKRDDVDLERGQWNTDSPVDAGKHVVTASAPGKKTWRGTVDVPSAGGSATIEVPTLEDEAPTIALPAATTPKVPVATSSAPASSPSEAPPPAHGKSFLGPTAVAAGATGLVALGIGSYLGIEVFHAKSQPAGACNPNCNMQGGARNSAFVEGDASTALFIAGGVLVATGVTLWLIAPSKRSGDAALGVVPAVTPRSGSVAVTGSF